MKEWIVEFNPHGIRLCKYYEELVDLNIPKEGKMAGKNGKSKGTVDSVKSVGGGYAGVKRSWSLDDAATPEQGAMTGKQSSAADYSQMIKPGGRRDHSSRTIRSKNPSTGK